MIPNISKNGGSFRGAALYYLHDKAEDRQQAKADKPKSDERVAYVETRNLVSRDIDDAIDEMWRTAELQQQLKLASGARTSGRVCEDPVKTISLSWHPSERPTAEQQIAAADQFVERMGWAEHQAVYVGHRDTAHPHIHIILNRVHPETGRTLNDWREQKRAQDWARDYEKENGQIWCERRLLSEDEKKSAANANVPHNVIELARPSEAQFRTAEEERATRDAQEHAALKEQQKAERLAWMAEGKAAFKATRHAAYDQVRAEMRPKWREFYKESEVLRKDAEAASGSGVERALHFAKAGQWEKAWDAFDARDSVRDGIEDVIAARKAELVAEQMAERVAAQTAAVAVLKETRDAGYKDLLARQQGERASMKAAHGLGDSGAHLLREPEPRYANNENKSDQAPAVAIDPQSFAADGFRVRGEPVPAAEVAARAGAMVAEEPRVMSTPEAPEPVKQLPDLVAGSIGSVAEYLAEQIADAITPPTPKELAERAAATAKRAEQAPRPERDAYADQVNAAIKAAFEETEAKRTKDYWVERDRKKDFERDR